ncbi:Uncharacterized protein Rs2_21435 [Raphanus sativus]|nr:Uncharacterized protein Rs2_21435 [Raphanus sativus]
MSTSMAPIRPQRQISPRRRLSSLLTPPDLLFLSHTGSPLSVFHTAERYSTNFVITVPPPPRDVGKTRQSPNHHTTVRFYFFHLVKGVEGWRRSRGRRGGCAAKEARSGGVKEALSF